MRMLSDRILVLPDPGDATTPGGLHIPDTAQEKPERGKVLAIGEGRARPDGVIRPMRVAVGESVLFSKGVGNTIVLDGEEHIVLREDDVIAVLEKGE